MKTTNELIEQIFPRYTTVRKKNLDFLWEDFLKAVENAISKLSDEILAATSSITISYLTKEGDNNIYRSETAEYNDDQTVKYEEEDICLGTKKMLEIAFTDFKEKAEKDDNICADWFDVEELNEKEECEIQLDFKLPKNVL